MNYFAGKTISVANTEFSKPLNEDEGDGGKKSSEDEGSSSVSSSDTSDSE